MSKQGKSLVEAVSQLPDQKEPPSRYSWLRSLEEDHPQIFEDVMTLAKQFHNQEEFIRKKFRTWAIFSQYVLDYVKDMHNVKPISRETLSRYLREELCQRNLETPKSPSKKK